MVRQADVAGAARPAEGAGEAPDTRIEERRGYRLQFDEAEALVAAYGETQEACVASEHCQVEQGRLQTPRHGLASGYLALRERLKELAQEGRGFSERRIQDLLQVERELARVQGEIESMQGQQRHLARVTETVAISADFRQQRWVEPRQHGVLAPLWRALDRSMSLFFESVGQVILVVVFLTPWLVIGLPVLWLLSRLWRPVRRALSRLGESRRARRKADDA